jgi:hypothetical protein
MVGAVLTAMLASAVAQQNDAESAKRLAEMVNAERTRAGLEPLAWDDRIAQAAYLHNQKMAERRDLSHQFPGEPKLRERMAATGAKFNDDAENVAYDTTLEQAHTHLMESRGHRENIMNPRYNAIGVSVIRQGGLVYVVEDFARRLTERSDSEVADVVLAAFNRERRAAQLPAVVRSQNLRNDACRMAETDKVTTTGVTTGTHAMSVVAFTTFQPEELPSSVKQRVGEPQLRSVAIGACFARTPSYPAGIDWVVMAFYP